MVTRSESLARTLSVSDACTTPALPSSLINTSTRGHRLEVGPCLHVLSGKKVAHERTHLRFTYLLFKRNQQKRTVIVAVVLVYRRLVGYLVQRHEWLFLRCHIFNKAVDVPLSRRVAT